MPSVLLADDHELVLDGLQAVLEHAEDIDVVAACRDGAAAVDSGLRTAPEVALLDLQMPELAGVEAAKVLLAARPTTRVVILTGHLTPTSVRAAHAAGAVGYQLKGDVTQGLPELIRQVAAGATASCEPARVVLDTPRPAAEDWDEPPPGVPLAPLTGAYSRQS